MLCEAKAAKTAAKIAKAKAKADATVGSPSVAARPSDASAQSDSSRVAPWPHQVELRADADVCSTGGQLAAAQEVAARELLAAQQTAEEEQIRAQAAAKQAELEHSDAQLDALGLRERGNESFAYGKWEEAERLYTAALSKIETELQIEERATTLSNRAAARMKQCRWIPALSDTHSAYALNPTFLKVKRLMALCSPSTALEFSAFVSPECVF